MLAQISIAQGVQVMFVLIVACAIGAIFVALIAYCERKWPAFAPFAPFLYVALALIAAFILIGFLLSLLGYQVFRP